jgi:hypothetical protein
MHREVRDHIEELLGGSKPAPTEAHLGACPECRETVDAMAQQAAALRQLKSPADLDTDLRPGFYARVMERIEAEGPISIWNLFIESAFGRRIAVASLALALLLGVYLVTLERNAEEPVVAGGAGEIQFAADGFDQIPRATSVRAIDGFAGLPADLQSDPFVTQMDDFVNQINRLANEMEQSSSSQDGVLADIVTYREQ